MERSLIGKIKCFLFGHPRNRMLRDEHIVVKVSTALEGFELRYCFQCKELYFERQDVLDAIEEPWKATLPLNIGRLTDELYPRIEIGRAHV